MADYLLLNRCALTLVPKSSFWEWVNKTCDMDNSFTAERETDSNMYLIPSYESEENIRLAIEKYLYQNYVEIFTSELEAWNMDPATFPEISYNLFTEWFNVHIHTMIFDTVRMPLKRE